LLGGTLSSLIQSRSQRRNQLFQINLENSKREFDFKKKQSALALERLATAHCLLSYIDREFSVTVLDVNWRTGMTDSEYDQKYLSVCCKADDLRIIANLYETSLSNNVSAPRKARRIWWGESPGMVRVNQPPLPSVAPLAERCFGKDSGSFVNKRGEAYTGYVVDRWGTQPPRAGIASKWRFRSASVVTCVKPTRTRCVDEPGEGRRSSQTAVCNQRCVENAGAPCGSYFGNH